MSSHTPETKAFAEIWAANAERIAFNLCSEFGSEFVKGNQAFAKAAVREFLLATAPKAELVDAAYEAAKAAMPHEALSEIGAGELERVVRAVLEVAARSLEGK